MKKTWRKTKMQCAHQQLGRDSLEDRDDQNAIPAGFCRENRRDTIEPFWLGSARAPSSDARWETKATWRRNQWQVLRCLRNVEKAQSTGRVKQQDELGSGFKVHRWCEKRRAQDNVSDKFHTSSNQCTYTGRFAVEIKRVSVVEASDQIRFFLQKQLWQF